VTVSVAQAGTVAASRVAALSKCVNISLWFRYPPDGAGDAHFKDYVSAEELSALKARGVTGVRLGIAPKQIFSSADPAKLDAKMLAYVDAAVDRITKAGLVVIVDLHDESRLLEGGKTAVDRFNAFWTSFASHIAKRTDPQKVFLEIVNEPVFYDKQDAFAPIQDRLLRTVRAAAPKHTLIATGPQWSSVLQLSRIRPSADPNIVYTFHFYEPFPFTHQGAEWIDGPDQKMKDVPYPASPEGVAPLIELTDDPAVKEALAAYGESRFNIDSIRNLLTDVTGWTKKFNTTLFCGEFGVYNKVAPGEDRLRWFADVKQVFSERKIGWCVWGYDESLGLNRTFGADGAVQIDEGVAKALGLE
jgi:endoglucanase